MPIYEYSCRKCKDDFSVFQSIDARGKDVKCPGCGCPDVQRKLSTFSCCSTGGGSTLSAMSSGRPGGG